MAANWSKPTLDSLYTVFRDELIERADDHAKMFNSTNTTNLPPGVVKWNGSENKFDIKIPAGWEDLSTEYKINVEKLGGLTSSEYTNTASSQNITGAKVFTNNTEIQGTTTLKGDVVLGDSATNEVTFNAKVKNTTFSGDVTLEGVNTDLSVGGNSALGGTLSVSGNSVLGGTLSVSSNFSVNGHTTLGNASSDTITLTGTVGATTFNGDVTLSGTSTDLTVGGAITVAGATTLNGNVTLGNAAADTILINGDIHGASNTVDIKDALNLSSTLTVASTADFNSSITTRAITMDNDYHFIAGSNGNHNGDFIWYSETAGEYFEINGGTGNTTIHGVDSQFTMHGQATVAGASTTPLYMYNDGRLYLSNTAEATSLSDSSVSLTVKGGATVAKNLYVGGTIYESSARELKENIEPLVGSLGKIRLLEGVSYNKISNGQKEIGLIADEVLKVIPEVVSSKDGKAEALHYSRLTAVLIEAVKELTNKVESLEAQIQRS
jgi:hypothetical protein